MKMNADRNWLKQKAALEDGGFVSVGGLISAVESLEIQGVAEPEPLKHAFVKLLQLKRRERALTLEEFAAKADVDLGEIVRLESDETYAPSILTVARIADFFSLPKKPLMALAGLLRMKDVSFRQEALRFAARSEPVEELSPEEHRALEEYVKFLCER